MLIFLHGLKLVINYMLWILFKIFYRSFVFKIDDSCVYLKRYLKQYLSMKSYTKSYTLRWWYSYKFNFAILL